VTTNIPSQAWIGEGLVRSTEYCYNDKAVYLVS
jgi:hypothetical protein